MAEDLKKRRLIASAVLARDASVKIVKAAQEYDKNPIDALYKLLFATAESTSVIAGLLLDAMMEER